MGEGAYHMTLTDEISLTGAGKSTAKDKGTGGASAPALGDNLMTVGAAVLHAQGRALVIERQASLQILRDPTGVGADAAAAQATMREAASHYFDVVQPQVIALFGAVSGAANLMNAAVVLNGPTAQGDDLPQILGAVTGQLDQLTATARDTARTARASADVTGSAAGALDKALTAAIDRLEGEGGEIAQLRDRIDSTEKAIFQGIDDIVKNSNVVGQGIKSLVTYVMGTFGGGGDSGEKEKPKPAADKTKPDAATAGTDKTAPKESGAIEPFPAESIDTISTGAEGVAKAQALVKAKNTLLAAQYQELAALDALLAAAQVISGQTAAMADTAKRLGDALAQTAAITGAIADELRALTTRAAKPEARKDVRAKLAALAGSWTRLSAQMGQIQSALSGIGKLFPPLTPVGN